jgi:DNA-binding CsgD family transcriptional regulator
MINNTMNISDEFYICRFNNGVKILSPDVIENRNFLHRQDGLFQNIKAITELPFAVYLENKNHITIKSNEITAETCGFSSLKKFIGKPWHEKCLTDSVVQSLKNDNKVMENHHIQIFEEQAFRQDGGSFSTLAVRMPWYDDHNKIIGLFGCSIILGVNSLAESLKEITKLGLLTIDNFQAANNILGTEIEKVYLTKREMESLRLYVQGKTAKEIGTILSLSCRTIENYIQNIKNKMNVSTKADLIYAARKYFL